MDDLKLIKIRDQTGTVSKLKISGSILLKNSQQLKTELIEVLEELSDDFEVAISEVEEIDLAGIQLFMAFFSELSKRKSNIKIYWDLSEDQKSLIEKVGFNTELYLEN